MSFNHWKLLNLVKDIVTKYASDRSLPNPTEIANEYLQTIQKISGIAQNNISRVIQSKTDHEKGHLNDKVKDSQFLPELRSKIRIPYVTELKTVIPKWKVKKIPEGYMLLTLEQSLKSLENATSEEVLNYSLEEFIQFLLKYPEMKNKAAKMGAIKIVLRARSKSKSGNAADSSREALALLGYVESVPNRGIRVLSIDGGGIRGLLVLEMLKKLEEITGKRVNELFDFICGVSTGAILALSIGYHNRSLDEIAHRYEDISKQVFKQSSWKGTGSLVWSHAYYDTTLWEQKLKEYLGHEKLISTSRNPKCPKLCAVSAIVNQERLSAFVFRNYSLPWKFQSQYMGCNDSELWQAARASAAAPTYFEEYKLGNFLHQDGGILVNNPTAIALHEVRLLWPNTPLQCVVSFGTGRTVPSSVEMSKTVTNPESTSNNTSWTNKFYKILDSATDTEAVHIMLTDLLPDHLYYRFNPYLTEHISMVEIDDLKLEQLRRDAIMYLRRNEDKFQEVAKALTKPKTLQQKIKHFIKEKRDMYGL